MGDELPTIWPAEPHTKAKHAILRNYLNAWSPIMARQAQKMGRATRSIRFVDAFAGPGIYKNGEDGSPILALKSALDHKHDFPVPIHFLFIEKDPKRFASLTESLTSLRPAIARSSNVSLDEPVNDDCERVLDGLLLGHQGAGTSFGPALVFLDQFGYSDVSMSLIARIMLHPQCEVLSYMNYAGLNRFFSDEQKNAARTTAFGNEDWREARERVGTEREQSLLQGYKRNLREVAKARFVWDFAMADENERLIYWLFFCTNNPRGLEEMKKAMWRVDDTGSFRFSDDQDPSQMALFESYDDAWLAAHLCEVFMGKSVTVREVRDHVLTDTPCFKFASLLQQLRRDKKLCVPGSTGRVSFAKDLELRMEFREL